MRRIPLFVFIAAWALASPSHAMAHGDDVAEIRSFMERVASLMQAGDLAYTPFRYQLSADTGNGHIEIGGRGTAVLEKMDGRWRILHTHTSGRPKR